MAERLGSEAEDATRQHNVQARTEAIQKGLEEIYQLKKKIKAAIKKHVKDHRNAITDIKTKLREDYQMPAKLLNARLVSYELERFAVESGNEATQDAIKKMYEAAPVETQFSMFGKGNGKH